MVGAAYRISFEECEATYVAFGETKFLLKARFGEHRRLSSTTSEASKHIGYIWTAQPHHHIGEDEDIVRGTQLVIDGEWSWDHHWGEAQSEKFF